MEIAQLGGKARHMSRSFTDHKWPGKLFVISSYGAAMMALLNLTLGAADPTLPRGTLLALLFIAAFEAWLGWGVSRFHRGACWTAILLLTIIVGGLSVRLLNGIHTRGIVGTSVLLGLKAIVLVYLFHRRRDFV